MSLQAQSLSKRFGTTNVLDGVALDIADGAFVALLGPSGSGKTTLLRLIAGLEQPDAGSLAIDGEDALVRPPGARGIGFVFQHYALFRHMSVFENVAFGLRVRPRRRRPSRAAIRQRVEALLQSMQLDGLGPRLPSQLSGGQRQRVALARALAVEPRLLLLDEPFGALDQKVRLELRDWLRGLHARLGLTTIFVTHDQEEAFALADRIVLLNQGRVEQVGTPSEIQTAPASSFVRDFVANTEPPRPPRRAWLIG
jgi:sulfate transport system ATP-binding protein